MGIAALTRRDDGTEIAVPLSENDWRQWLHPADTRNWMLDDQLSDWLQLYGESLGYVPEQETDQYVEELDFRRFVAERSREFKNGILRLLTAQHNVLTIARSHQDVKALEQAQITFAAMRQGVPVIHRGVLWDAEHMTYGAPDFLIRSDILRDMFPKDIADDAASVSAPDLGADGWHYRVVNARFATLELNAAGTELANGGSGPAHKAQLYIYNRMLGRLQGYLPEESYLLGRGWRRTEQRNNQRTTYRGTNALERLGRVPQDGTIANRVPISNAVADAVRWVRRLRAEGQNWLLSPVPSVPELYPNMSGAGDDMMVDRNVEAQTDADTDGATSDWTSVKGWLAAELKELTQLWYVRVAGRKQAHDAGFFRWDDPGVTPAQVGVTGPQTGPTLAQILAVNTDNGPPARPTRIEATRDEWHTTAGVEFYVDFEYCSDLNDDFTNLPEKGGQPLIFMIGCGHVENGEWSFRSLVTDDLSLGEELRIIREWMAHMDAVGERLDPANRRPRVFHWSGAEVNALKSARERHQAGVGWPEPAWFDFLGEVMRKEPVVVRNALNFGLKSVARAMRSHGLISTDWADNPVDGLGAMVGAWRCDAEARQQSVSMAELPLMRQIAEYNEVDCKAIMEIVRYLRAEH